MRAGVWQARGVIAPDDVAEPTLRDEHDVLVAISYAGICGSDLHIVDGRLLRAGQPPRVIGHEMVGRILDVGRAVRDLAVGERVVGNFIAYCGGCYYCRNGQEHFCRRMVYSAEAFAERGVYRDQQLLRVADDIDDRTAALAEPLSVCVHAVDRAGLRAGARALVLGAGPIGLLITQIARLAGAGLVAVSEPSAVRRDLALAVGADVAVDPRDAAATDTLKTATGMIAFDCVFETSGVPAALSAALPLVARGGRLVVVGVHAEDATIPVRPFDLYAKELTLTGSYTSPYAFPRAVALLPRIDAGSLVSDVVPLSDIAAAFERLRRAEAAKILLRP
jgi:2-desacetyl-2-hydroxyethyl bacteriochlorophyllide A dehydrogenase